MKKAELDIEPIRQRLFEHLEKTGHMERTREAYQNWLDVDRELMNESYRFIRGLGIEGTFGEGAVVSIMNILGDEITREFAKQSAKEPLDA